MLTFVIGWATTFVEIMFVPASDKIANTLAIGAAAHALAVLFPIKVIIVIIAIILNCVPNQFIPLGGEQ